MKQYQVALLKHLGKYAKERLGVFEEGIYQARSYPHILPSRLRFLNFLESIRAEMQSYLAKHPLIKLHKYFHHLNSSQAFAFNLFYPYFAASGAAAKALSASLGLDRNVIDWEFEAIPDREEGTNVDVVWRTTGNTTVFCEVKLSESQFGATKSDERHLNKIRKIYEPRLKAVVSEILLKESTFCKNYQLLRNIALLTGNDSHLLVILLPRENESLAPPLKMVKANIDPSIRDRIKVIYVEDCLNNLLGNPSLPPELRLHALNIQEKYIPVAQSSKT